MYRYWEEVGRHARTQNCQSRRVYAHFYMCGQWIEPGGGLPSAVMSARRLIQTICKEDKEKFHTTVRDSEIPKE